MVNETRRMRLMRRRRRMITMILRVRMKVGGNGLMRHVNRLGRALVMHDGLGRVRLRHVVMRWVLIDGRRDRCWGGRLQSSSYVSRSARLASQTRRGGVCVRGEGQWRLINW